jgi:Protein of unknown function (DUF3363)
MSGVGQEVRNAMETRAEHLAADELAHRQGLNIVPQRDLLATLRRRKLDAVGPCRRTILECPTRRRQPASWLPAPCASAPR